MRHFAREILNFLQNLWDGGIFGPHCRGRACPARGLARPPFNGQLPLTPRAGHARPLPRGCHRLPGGVKTAPPGGLALAGWPVGAAYMPPGTFAAAETPRAAYMRPLQTVPKNGVYGLARRGGIHAARDVCDGGSSAGRIYAAREPCAAANTPGGINPSPTHCPQTTACMAGRRGRRPLRRAFLFVPPGTNSTFFIIYYLLSLIYLLFAPFVV